MPRSHLLRVGLRFSVCFFRHRRTTACTFTLYTGIVGFRVWELGERPDKAVRRLCGGRTEIMRCRCGYHATSADSVRISYGARAGSVQIPHEMVRCLYQGHTITVRFPPPAPPPPPYDHRKFYDFRKINARPPHDAPMICLRAYDFFSNLT